MSSPRLLCRVGVLLYCRFARSDFVGREALSALRFSIEQVPVPVEWRHQLARLQVCLPHAIPN
jgi:hypothetical protein